MGGKYQNQDGLLITIKLLVYTMVSFAPRHIANKLDIPRSSIYGLMRKLKKDGEI
jgi:sugar-specific transcriptional regulator TrmB